LGGGKGKRGKEKVRGVAILNTQKAKGYLEKEKRNDEKGENLSPTIQGGGKTQESFCSSSYKKLGGRTRRVFQRTNLLTRKKKEGGVNKRGEKKYAHWKGNIRTNNH